MPELIGSFFYFESYYLIQSPSGRLAGVWDGWRGGISGHKKSRGTLEGESPRQLKFQRPV